MELKKVLGFSLKPARIDPDGTSAPPETAALSPPSEPAEEPAAPLPLPDRAIQQTRIEEVNPLEAGLAANVALQPPLDDAADATASEAHPATPEAPAVDALDGAGAPSSKDGVSRDLDPSEEQEDGPPNSKLVTLTMPLLRWCERRRRLALGVAGSAALATAAGLGFWLGGSDTQDSPSSSAATEGSAEGDPESTDSAPPSEAQPDARAKPVAETPAEPDAVPDAWQNVPEVEPTPCAPLRAPAQLHGGLSPAFPIEASSAPGSVEVLVGAASSPSTALGLRVNATTLAAQRALDETLPRAILGVVPEAQGSPPSFTVDRAGIGGHRDWRTLPGDASLALTRTNRGVHLVRRSATRRSVSLWALGTDEEASRAQVAWQDDKRFAAAFRRGGLDGAVVVGWVDRHSLRRSELRELPFTGTQKGTPSIGIQGKRAVVAAAVRDDEGGKWRLELSTTRWTGQTRRISPSPLPPSSRFNAFAPQIASLGDGRWLLQWTRQAQEGDKSRIHAMTLDADLAPISAVTALSPPEHDAIDSLVVSVDAGLLSMFLVRQDDQHALFGTTLACN